MASVDFVNSVSRVDFVGIVHEAVQIAVIGGLGDSFARQKALVLEARTEVRHQRHRHQFQLLLLLINCQTHQE
jgi:hypothetical protein